MSVIHSYPSIYNIGHAALAELLDDDVVIEEKVDGSQFSFGVVGGVLHCRSKGKELVPDNPEKMFAKAVETVTRLFREGLLVEGWVYRGEYLQSAKHNTLNYDRPPNNHIILYDIQTGDEQYMGHAEKKIEADLLGLEVVPVMHYGPLKTFDALKGLLEHQSCLGGAQVEGVVIKNYSKFGPDKKALMGKLVSEQFKEWHKTNWRGLNPTTGDIVQSMIESFRTHPRWHKAVQHLRDRGELEQSPRDIGKLMKEVAFDVHKECQDDIKQRLFDYAWPKISRGIVAGVAEWYKEELAKSQFENAA